ncbi:MAG: energy transducer TonB [Verrucomicrobiota bacterium]
MHKRNPIVNLPLLIGSVLSIAIHVVALYGKGIHAPPTASLEQGRTVVRLTLMPAVASQAAAPKPQIEEPVEQLAEEPVPMPVEPLVEQAFQPALPAEPVTESQPDPDTIAETEAIDSPEQDASLVEEKGVVTEARTSKAVHPAYSRISRRRGEEGTVTLSVGVLANGQPDDISVVQSSGYSRLDKAAIKAVQSTTFTPAKRFGRNIDSTTELSFTFRLTDD